jgi:molybdopterin-containing oxidoreductase family iron-sulfur binding subunit
LKTLIIHRLNIAYLAPKASGFVEALEKVGTVIYTGDQVDETGKLADYVTPDHHDFENWGDLELQKGVYSIQQPTVRPLYNTRSFQSSLMNWAYTAQLGPKRMLEPSGWYEYLQNYWKDQASKMGRGDFQSFWIKFLQDGYVNTSKRDGSTNGRNFATAALGRLNAGSSDGLELVMYEKIGLGDGSFANISWLQELPDPVSKIVWDNYLVVSPKRAKELGLRPDSDEGKVLRATTSNGAITLPVHIQPGAHDDVVGVAVGYGHTTGSVAANVGANVWSFAGFSKNGVVTSGLKVEKLEVLSEKIELANTQGHHYMEGRPIVAEATLADYLKNEKAGIKSHEVFSMWPTHEYKGYRWGMAIDLNTCTGCSACVTACQSENNIPVVGKKYVMQGREMHWMRIDRYYNGDVDNPQVVVQPMLCQHCENAPCETVCPVLATVHSSEGTNDMSYNRCVGTRYCANNCPYKVRRFNWFNYSKVEAPMNMAFNPDVTVRSRGVMEKCSFCVQRIHGAKDKARAQKRLVADGEVKTACQQACPTDAIVFGNMNDAGSEVSKLFASKRTYMVLDELNTLPSVRYQSKVRNTEKLGGSIIKGHRILRGEPS